MRTSYARLAAAFLFVLSCAPPAGAQSLLGELQQLRAGYPTPMTKAQLGELLTRTAQSAPGWVLLLKREGNNCPAMGTLVSCDYLVYGPTGQGYDVLRDQEGEAVPVWNSGDSFTPDRYVAVPFMASQPPPVTQAATSPAAAPPGPVSPVSAIDWGPAWARFDRIETQLSQVAEKVVSANEKMDRLIVDLQRHDDRPAWLQRALSNRFVQIAMASVGTWALERAMTDDDAPASTSTATTSTTTTSAPSAAPASPVVRVR